MCFQTLKSKYLPALRASYSPKWQGSDLCYEIEPWALKSTRSLPKIDPNLVVMPRFTGKYHCRDSRNKKVCLHWSPRLARAPPPLHQPPESAAVGGCRCSNFKVNLRPKQQKRTVKRNIITVFINSLKLKRLFIGLINPHLCCFGLFQSFGS